MMRAVEIVMIATIVLRSGGPPGNLSLAAAAKKHENAPRATTICR
jgi:hypothetical protein